MKELSHIEKMLTQGKLSTEQAALLKASLKESQERKTKLKGAKSDDDESPAAGKIWMVSGGFLVVLSAALVLSVGNKPLFFLLLLVLFSFGCAAAIFLLFFNLLVWKKEGVLRSRALITNEVERKEALVPQIQESVSAYAGHEAGTLENVVQERSSAGADITAGNLKLDQLSVPLQALAEKYPDIKADQTYMQLFNQLVETENRITAMVQWYNHKVHSYNSTVEAFPFSIVAGALSFKKATYLEST
jgi:LemA protein